MNMELIELATLKSIFILSTLVFAGGLAPAETVATAGCTCVSTAQSLSVGKSVDSSLKPGRTEMQLGCGS